MTISTRAGIGGRRHRRRRRAKARRLAASWTREHSTAARVLGDGFMFHASMGLVEMGAEIGRGCIRGTPSRECNCVWCCAHRRSR